MRRFFMFDGASTWHDWRLTLTAKDVTPPEPKTNYINLDGMSSSLDLSEALTGEVAYNDRTVSASFWTSEGTYQEREQMLHSIITALHGKRVQIIEPDDPEHYFLGRVTVKVEARTAVYLEFSIEAICDPWRYAIEETQRLVDVDGETVAVINNNGVKSLCPDVMVTGGPVTLVYGNSTVDLAEGSYKIADLRLVHGVNLVTCSGSGSVTFTYREAAL